MHIIVTSEDFAKALNPHLQIVPKRSHMPILTSLLWEIEDEGKLRITSTDLEMSLSTVAGVGGLFQSGEIQRTTVPAIQIFQIMQALPCDEVHIETQENRMSIKAGNGNYQIPVADDADYPAMDSDKDTHNLTTHLAEFTKAVKQTIFAVAKDSSRVTLCGVHLESIESGIHLLITATDGHRLAQVKNIKTHNPSDFNQPLNVIIPEKAIKFLSRFWHTTDLNDIVVIHYGDKFVKFVHGDEVLTSRLIEGEYPDVERVIPKAPPNTATVERDSFLKSVKRVALLSNDVSRQIKFAFNNEQTIVSTVDADHGTEAEERLAIEYHGEPLEIGFNARYLMENLHALESDNIIIKLTSPDSTAVIRPADDENVLMLLMPTRLTN